MVERRVDPPRAKRLARLLRLLRRRARASEGLGRLDLRCPELALTQAALLHRSDDRIDHVAASRPWQLSKRVGLHAEPHAGHRLAAGQCGQREARKGERAEFSASEHD
jgi:hypothetical protein